VNQLNFTGREPHPVLRLWTPEEEAADPKAAADFYEYRKKLLQAAQYDPLRYGYEPPIWKLADKHRSELRAKFPVGVIHEVNLGGHRASKTERAAKRAVQLMVANPGIRVWCCDSTEAQSRLNQMRMIWKYLPAEWRNEQTGMLRRTKTTKVKYTIAGGFTENIFVLPNRSECSFKFYEMNVDNLEGVELDMIWADELVPLEWITELSYRLLTRNGLFHITFTPKKGYTPTVGYYLDDAKTIEETSAELLTVKDADGKVSGCEMVPRIKQCKDQRARVIYFHTSDNPFGNYPAMIEEVRHKSRTEIEMKVYGVCSKAVHVQFPLFKESVHVISMNRFEEILKGNPDGIRYHLVDPCSGRNWFMIWIYCPSHGKKIVYREWPSFGHKDAYIPTFGDPGEWAVNSDAFDGARGPAQDTYGKGLDWYKEEILRVEKGEGIFERWIDARYSNSPKQEREGSTTLIEQLEDIQINFLASTSEKNILRDDNDGSIEMINNALEYDQEIELGKFSARLARINEPNLLFTENCPNMIWAMSHWTAKDGTKGACKDPIDCCRMAYLSELDFVDEKKLRPRSDWSKQMQHR